MVRGGRSVFLPQAHEHPQEQAHRSHQKDHQTSNQGLPNHFPVNINTRTSDWIPSAQKRESSSVKSRAAVKRAHDKIHKYHKKQESHSPTDRRKISDGQRQKRRADRQCVSGNAKVFCLTRFRLLREHDVSSLLFRCDADEHWFLDNKHVPIFVCVFEKYREKERNTEPPPG